MALGPSQPPIIPHAFYKSVYFEVIAGLHHNSHDDVIHACVLKACVS